MPTNTKISINKVKAKIVIRNEQKKKLLWILRNNQTVDTIV